MSGARSRSIALRATTAERVREAAARPRKVRVVVVGEFNSGKTTLVNTIAGAQVLTPSPIAHTAHPTVVTHAARPFLAAETGDRRRTRLGSAEHAPEGVRRLHVGVSAPSLRALSVIDTPALEATDEDFDPRVLAACRTADVLLWCTPAMQAWKASEARMWKLLPHRHGARGILAVTFLDLIPSADLDRLMARLQRDASALFEEIVPANACAGLVRGSIASL